ncbi:MAG: leucine-rich repeat domain-containing protein [Lachnospiraceae bacterium]|nr:leucine-rich repeat domain-containing protein [Lachnospiraceae bacterium]
MKKKIIALLTVLTLVASLSACGKDTTTSSNNSDADKRIAELEQELEELRAENKDLKAQLGDTSSTEQQSSNETESVLKTTIESPETSGVCGADLTWSYKNGVLAITGTGEMTDYSSYEDTPWYDLIDKIGWIIIDEGTTTIGINAFTSYNELSKIVLPDTLTSIGDYAFYECNSLKEVIFPKSLTSIGDYAFYECNSLKEVTFPKSLTNIGDCSFCACDSLKEITFKCNMPDDLDQIWFRYDAIAFAEGTYATEDEELRAIGELLASRTIYYTGDTFDELINSYPYWSDYGVEWIKQ